MPESNSQSYFKNLDALRFLSFFSVFIAHVWMFTPSENSIAGFLFSIFTFQSLLVPFFFTLSSFLITYKLLREKRNSAKIGLLHFYKRRALRIWPAYFMLILTCFAILPALSEVLDLKNPTLPPLLPFLLFYVNFYMIQHGAAFTFALTILWSISIEEQFYLVWGAAMKWMNERIFIIVVAALFMFSIAFGYHYLIIQQKAENNLAIHSIFILQNFSTGALLAYIAVNKNKAFSFLSKLHPGFYLLVYAVLFTADYFLKDMVLLNAIKSITYALIIFDQVFYTRRFFNAGKFRFINYLGKISYGLYLYHALIFVILQKQLNLFKYGDAPLYFTNILHAGVAFLFTFIIAHLSFKFVESKFLALKSG